nr:Dihydrofolate reductase [uncultured bacterium]
MKLTFVVAVAKNGVIGTHNTLPFYIPEDLKHFKKVTLGKTVLMGKNTYDSIFKRLGKPLPERINVVISHQNLQLPEGVLLFHSIDEALQELKDTEEIMVIGGGQIYTQMIDKADKLILTEVHHDVEGDVLFPPYDRTKWKEIAREDHEEFSFVEYERK